MKNKSLTGSSIIAAILASLCCIGPLLLVGFGIGSAAFFSQFQIYRPYLIIISILLLIPAFYLSYKEKEIACEDGSCKIENSGKWNKIALWFATILTALFIAIPSFGINTLSFASTESVTNISQLPSVSLKINNMDCEACARGLESQLKEKEGIVNVDINFALGRGNFQFDPQIIKPEQLIKILDTEGFPSTIMETKNGKK